jgi:hypothetical protein
MSLALKCRFGIGTCLYWANSARAIGSPSARGRKHAKSAARRIDFHCCGWLEDLHEFGKQTRIAVALHIPNEWVTRLSTHVEVQLIRII